LFVVSLCVFRAPLNRARADRFAAGDVAHGLTTLLSGFVMLRPMMNRTRIMISVKTVTYAKNSNAFGDELYPCSMNTPVPIM
jgi:hypothetical protein